MPTLRDGRLAIDGELITGDIHIADGWMVDEPEDDRIIDSAGLIVSPGLIDIQINGGFGRDFTRDPATIWEVGTRLPELGVTSFLPTIVTTTDDITDRAIEVVAGGRPDGYRGAEVLGLHFEGPWISPDMHGAHNPALITDPDVEVARRWAESGIVKIVTLAPELPGAADVAEVLTRAGVVVSVGHSNASFATASGAFSTYATLTTHLFNQMSPLRHREPGVVGAALLSDHPAILIADEYHLAEGALRLAWRLLGPRHAILVTDAMAAMGLGPGTYPLGDEVVTVGEDGPRTEDGRLAGCVATLPEAVANLASATGATVAETLMCASANPARLLGLEDRGLIRVGARADLVLLGTSLRPVRTVLGGRVIDL